MITPTVSKCELIYELMCLAMVYQHNDAKYWTE